MRLTSLVAIAAVAVPLTAVGAQSTATPATPAGTPGPGLRFVVSLPASARMPHDGRLLLIISTDSTREPRLQMSDHDNTQQMFGIDVHDLSARHPGVFDTRAFGYPGRASPTCRPATTGYRRCSTRTRPIHRSDGHTVELPPDHGEGQQWNRAPGSPMSRPRKVHIDPRAGGEIRIVLDYRRPAARPRVHDTKYVKHVRIQSDRLTKFWGRPMYLSAILVLPEGFDTHPAAHYPLAIYQGHFQRDPAVVARGAARHVAARARYGEDRRTTVPTAANATRATGAPSRGSRRSELRLLQAVDGTELIRA